MYVKVDVWVSKVRVQYIKGDVSSGKVMVSINVMCIIK